MIAVSGTRVLEALTFLTVKQAAELLQVTPEHVHRQIRAGKMPGAEYVLGVWRIRTSVLLGREAEDRQS